ncbi:hypothetical protein [Moheibacter sediminis]|uniref:Uncharacterized protein n=1 Tax=Moheibacter sediminis TaxID=1434700 RepID=A0A1W1YGI9_9FLAO|nr:hypothetical protein [Moheibacter sediminis]SMC35330.1 hypothetical protein SAMN06296427_101352 [Moheibacter sediminis]
MKMFKFFYGIFILCFILSCSEDDSSFISQDSSSNSSILRNGNVSKLNNPGEFTGEFKVWKNESDEIVFYTESEKSINVITCQNCNNIDGLDLKGKGTLTFLDHSFVFNNGEKSYYFAVDKSEEKEIKSLFGLSFQKENEYYGTGITYHWLDKDSMRNIPNFLSAIIKVPNAVEFIISMNDLEGKISGGCSSGGEGASSCSMGGGGCSVSCGSGYFACCNPGGCNCLTASIFIEQN